MVFLYTAPFFVALGSYQFLGERLRASQWGGLALSFAGVALAIGVPQADVDAKVLLGRPDDRRRRRAVGGDHAGRQGHARCVSAAPEKALGYQVAISIPILALAAWLFGRNPHPGSRRRWRCR